MLKLEGITRQTDLALQHFQRKIAFSMGPVELNDAINRGEDLQIIDVRTREEYDKCHIENAVHMPPKDFKSHLSMISKEKISIIYCYSQNCHLAAKCAIVLAANGYPVVELEGGFDSWKNEDYPVVSE